MRDQSFNFIESSHTKTFALLCYLAIGIQISHLIRSDVLIQVSDEWRYAKGSEIALNHQQAPWYLPEYNDLSWNLARGGFVGGTTSLQQATRFVDFGLSYHSLFFRTQFEVSEPEDIHNLVLRLQFKHGIILWLNGHPILVSGFGEIPASDVEPLDRSSWRSDLVFEELLLNQAIPFLQKGTNTLAAQVHASVEQTAFSFVAELSANFTRQPMVHHVSSQQALISWKTPTLASGRVHYGLVQDNLNHAIEFGADTVEPEVLFESLKSGCIYYYQVELETSKGSVLSNLTAFKTPDDESRSVRFSVLGDSGRGTLVQYRVAEQIRQTNPDLVFHTGDTVYPSLIPELVDLRYYSIYGPHMASTPYYVATGNHDLDRGRTIPSTLYHRPKNDTSPIEHVNEFTFDESYYTVRHGPAQFFVLFAPFFYQYVLTKDNPQYLWLQKALSESTSPWKFIFAHHPIRTSSLHRYDDYNRNSVRDTEELGNLLLPLAKEYGVQMIFSGHDHVYERFQPVFGVVSMITAGGGGSLYPLRKHDSLSSKFLSQYHFVNVDIEGDTCQLNALDDEGNSIDTLTIHRRPIQNLSYKSTWHSPLIETGPANDGDGNVMGQQFDFTGAPLVANLGDYSHAGNVIVHNDADYLYLGFQSLALPDDGALMFFIGEESKQLVGDPTHLAFLQDLEFDDWHPQLIGILGDEFADATQIAFDRSANGILGPQGLFHAGEKLEPVLGARIQQYNLSPQSLNLNLRNTHLTEQNADFVEVAIPLESISEFTLNASLRLSVVSGRQPHLEQKGPWSFDRSLIGGQQLVGNQNAILMNGVSLQLSLGEDSDGDGLSDPEEALYQTNKDDDDTDGDNLPDAWEIFHELSPVLAVSRDGSRGDADEDGQINIDEWLANTDPQDPESKLVLQVAFVESEVIQLKWQSMPEVIYTIHSSRTVEGPYTPLEPFVRFENTDNISKIFKHHLNVLDEQTYFFQLVASRKVD
jgi:hypothetical protein